MFKKILSSNISADWSGSLWWKIRDLFLQKRGCLKYRRFLSTCLGIWSSCRVIIINICLMHAYGARNVDGRHQRLLAFFLQIEIKLNQVPTLKH